VGQVIVCRGPGSLGQEMDACAALIAYETAGPEAALAMLEGEGELARPVLDVDALREQYLAEQAGEETTVPVSPVALSRLLPSSIAGGDPFEKQVPIYLLPGQASAQAGFLVAQQGEPLLAPFLRRLFQLGSSQGG